MLTGWLCPKCGKGVHPLVTVCPCADTKTEVPVETPASSEQSESTPPGPYEREPTSEELLYWSS